jgi:predicted RNA-binding protein YlqC (UPF0109 family)
LANSSAANLVTLMEVLAKSLVEKPEEVFVEEFDEPGHKVIEIEVAEDEVGRLIGRQGRMARNLRTIMNAAALRTHKRYELEIVE